MSMRKTAAEKPVPKAQADAKNKEQTPLSKPLSPFFLFRKEVYEQLRVDNPNVHVTKLAKICGEKWGALSAEAKARYEQEFIKNKEEYQEALQCANKCDEPKQVQLAPSKVALRVAKKSPTPVQTKLQVKRQAKAASKPSKISIPKRQTRKVYPH
jgi:hypothetical protein